MLEIDHFDNSRTRTVDEAVTLAKALERVLIDVQGFITAVDFPNKRDELLAIGGPITQLGYLLQRAPSSGTSVTANEWLSRVMRALTPSRERIRQLAESYGADFQLRIRERRFDAPSFWIQAHDNGECEFFVPLDECEKARVVMPSILTDSFPTPVVLDFNKLEFNFSEFPSSIFSDIPSRIQVEIVVQGTDVNKINGGDQKDEPTTSNLPQPSPSVNDTAPKESKGGDPDTAPTLTDLLAFVSQAQDRLDNPDLPEDPMLNTIQLLKAFQGARKYGLAESWECSEDPISNEGARRKFADLNVRLRALPRTKESEADRNKKPADPIEDRTGTGGVEMEVDAAGTRQIGDVKEVSNAENGTSNNPALSKTKAVKGGAPKQVVLQILAVLKAKKSELTAEEIGQATESRYEGSYIRKHMPQLIHDKLVVQGKGKKYKIAD